MSRTAPQTNPERRPQRLLACLSDNDWPRAHSREHCVRERQPCAPARLRPLWSPGFGFVRGIVRDMDVAPEAPKEGFTAFPRTNPETGDEGGRKTI
jgi:hypothetical protein